ncbi:porin [Poseidonocella sedimentorum]|uniref:Porin n=1 Tax=Poseidonocella sedimentorum TaxID=871652 RepID=A0A1I6ENR9_9RHOB|nr:porin [Poseidonocella sedimentorum]SFR19267.1 porin [Poseidonocella sedimentorum]
MPPLSGSARPRPLRPLVLAGGLAAVSAVALLRAEQGWADQGLTATVDIAQRLEQTSSSDGDSDEGLRALTTLGFGLQSITRGQELTVSASTSLAYHFDPTPPQDSFDTESSALRFGYTARTRDAELALTGAYSQADIRDAVFALDTETDEIVVLSEGTRESLSFGADLDLWTTGPLGLELGASRRVLTYDSDDSSLNDSTVESLRAALVLRSMPNLTARFFVRHSSTDESGAGATDSESLSYGASAEYDIDRLTRVSASLSQQDTERTETDGDTSRTEGLGLSLGLTRALPDGSLSFSVSQSQSDNGTRHQIRFGRSLSLPRTTLSFSLGATRTEGFTTHALAGVELEHRIDRLGALSVALSQSATTNSDDDEAVATRLSVSYDHTLSPRAALSAGLALVQEDVLDSRDGDASSMRLNLSYSHAVGADWRLVSGYSFTRTREEGAEDEDSSRIHLGLQKSFAFRP